MRRGAMGVWLLPVLLAIPALAQMGNPSAGPEKIPNRSLDPARGIEGPALESTLHKPLPVQYIWTRQDSVPSDFRVRTGWSKPFGQDLAPRYFRRSFTLAAVPRQATLYIAGPRSAVIDLNGTEIGHYQLVPDGQVARRVFAYDVTRALRRGGNVLAVEAVRGQDRGGNDAGRLGTQLARGEAMAVEILPAARDVVAPPLVMTDGQWQASMHASSGWENAQAGGEWQPAEDLGGIESSIAFFQWNLDAGLYAWPGYDGISPFLAQYHLRPSAVRDIYPGVGSIENADDLTRPSPSGEFTVMLPARSVREQQAPQILLDFGREVAGRIEIQSDSSQPASVTVQYGESEGEARLQPYLGVNPIHLAPHATAYGPKSAFRFVLIRFTGGRKTAYKSIELDGIDYPVRYRGYFDSSDSLLNRMWAIGAYTAHLCMQDDIWDAPKRDRGRWMGDLDVSGRTIEDVFGGNFLMNDTLDRLLGPAPVEGDVNGIPGYSAFWVIGEAEYYRHYGDRKQLASTHARLVELLRYMETELNARDLFANTHHAWPFVDWSPNLYGDTPQSRAGTQFEFYAAFRQGAWLLRQLGDTANAAAFEKEAAALDAAAQRYLLKPNGSFGPIWQVNAYAVLSGAAGPAQYPAIWRNVLSSVGKPQDDGMALTPYYNYFIVSAMAKMGHRQAALDWIRSYWGGMTREGATSFWEGYSPAWYKGANFHASLQADAESGYVVSLAHGWSSGVTPWLMEQVLGIHARAAGFSRVFIRPDLIDLQWAKGAEPTPHGLLTVGIRKNGASAVETIGLPAGIDARVSVPLAPGAARVLVNGKAVSSAPAENGTRAVIALGEPGAYTITSR